MIRIVAVFTFVLVVGVCSYVFLNPGSYSTLVLCLAGFVLCVAARALAPVWRIYLAPHHPNSGKRRTPGVTNALDARRTTAL
jgi:hypothetical protein